MPAAFKSTRNMPADRFTHSSDHTGAFSGFPVK